MPDDPKDTSQYIKRIAQLVLEQACLYTTQLSAAFEAAAAADRHLRMTSPSTYAVLGSTGNCGTALIENLLKNPKAHINAYCRNRSKLLRLLPNIKEGRRVNVFEGYIQDVELLAD